MGDQTGNPFFPTGVSIVTEAIEADQATEYAKALPLYDKALEWFLKGLEYEKNPMAKESIKKRVIGYMDRAEALKKVLKEQNQRGKDKGKEEGCRK